MNWWRAFRVVARGGKFLSPRSRHQRGLHMFHHGAAAAHERLTDREFQVLLLIASGKPPARSPRS